MDHGHSFGRPFRPIPSDLAAPASRIVSFLGGGGRAVVLTGAARSGKRALLDALLAGMSGRVTRLENRSAAPLAFAGILQQMGLVADDASDERGLFFRSLAEQAYDDYSAVLAIEDAHTLSAFALESLARVPGLGGPDLPGMILVLSGEASLLDNLAAPGLELFGNPRRTLLVELPGSVPGEATVMQAAVPPMMGHPEESGGPSTVQQPVVEAVVAPGIGPAAEPTSGWAHGRLGIRALVLAGVGGAAIAIAGLTWHVDRRPVFKPATLAAPQAATLLTAPASAPATALLPDAPADPAVAVRIPSVTIQLDAAPEMVLPGAAAALEPVVADPEAAMRRDFDAFLNRAGRDTAKLTPVARETLFREYLNWRARTPTEAPLRSP